MVCVIYIILYSLYVLCMYNMPECVRAMRSLIDLFEVIFLPVRPGWGAEFFTRVPA